MINFKSLNTMSNHRLSIQWLIGSWNLQKWISIDQKSTSALIGNESSWKYRKYDVAHSKWMVFKKDTNLKRVKTQIATANATMDMAYPKK